MNNLKSLIFATLTMTLVALLPTAASAQNVNRHPSIGHRQAKQHTRIHHGVKSGSLTRREATRLHLREAAIRAREHRARRDGNGISKGERVRLQRSLKRTSHSIHRQEHDRQHRP